MSGDSADISTKETGYNPYVAARREWNERYGDHIKSAHNWKMATFAISVVAAIAVSGLVFIGAKSKFLPYVIEVDGEGRIKSSGVPEQGFISEKIIRAQLADWISDQRGVTSDRIVQDKNIKKVYALLAKGHPATQAVSQYYTDGGSPFERMKSETVSVTIETLLPQSKDSWHAEWTEEVRNLMGVVTSSHRMKGILTLQMAGADPVKNPLGIFIKHFSWQKRLGSK